MIIYKSFLRKKSTKIYIVIFTLLFSLITFSFLAKGYFINYVNSKYKGSYIEVETLDDIEKIDSIKNVNNYRSGIKYENILFISNDDLKNDETIIKDSSNDDKSIEIELDNKVFELNVVDHHSGHFDEVIISNELYNKISDINNLKTYRIYLYDWLNHDKTYEKIKERINCHEIVSFEHSEFNRDPHSIIVIFNIAILLITILSVIVVSISIQNVIIDETKKNTLYKKLGYPKKAIHMINTYKIIILLLISFILPVFMVFCYMCC